MSAGAGLRLHFSPEAALALGEELSIK